MLTRCGREGDKKSTFEARRAIHHIEIRRICTSSSSIPPLEPFPCLPGDFLWCCYPRRFRAYLLEVDSGLCVVHSCSSSPSRLHDSSLPRWYQRTPSSFPTVACERLKTIVGLRLRSNRPHANVVIHERHPSRHCRMFSSRCVLVVMTLMRLGGLPWIVPPRTEVIERRAWASPRRGLLCHLSAKQIWTESHVLLESWCVICPLNAMLYRRNVRRLPTVGLLIGRGLVQRLLAAVRLGRSG